MTILKVNGRRYELDVDAETPLLWVLRDRLGLLGTKYGCGVGACGACTVHVDGRAERSCLTTAAALGGSEITTIEGLSAGTLHPLQRAWLDEDVPQCGFCQAGQIMAAAALLRRTPRPTDDQIDEALRDQLCRCGTYQRIRHAIHRAAKAGRR